MKARAISNWMKSFHYGRPISSRPARTAAGHFRAIVGLLVVALLVLHLIYLVCLSSVIPWALVVFLFAAIALYLVYVLARMHIPVMWEPHYYTPIMQMVRAQVGIWSITVLIAAYACLNQPNQLWPLFILPVMIVSEHCTTNQLLGTLVEVEVILLGMAWLGSRQPLWIFGRSAWAFEGMSHSVTIALLGFLLHYVMRNLDARDERIEQLRRLLVHIPAQREPKAIRQAGLQLLMEMVNAQCGAIWTTDRQPGVLHMEAMIVSITRFGQNLDTRKWFVSLCL